MKTYKIGILGTGGIAEKMAITLGGRQGLNAMQWHRVPKTKLKPLPAHGILKKHTAHTKHWLMTRMWT